MEKGYNLSYGERLKEFEAEKQKLYALGINFEEYEQAIKELAEKYEL